MLGYNKRVRDRRFHGLGGERMFVPDLYVVHKMPQVHYCVQLGLRSNRGKCNLREAGCSRQEVSDLTRKYMR